MTSERGFTIIEVLIAVVLLTVGVLAMVTTAALTTRMVTQGQIDTEATALATQQFEDLKNSCPAAGTGGSTTKGPFTITWRVTADGVAGRTFTVQVSQPTMRGTSTRSYSTRHFCGG
jgi:type IV pilus modification protein PilV